MSNFIGKSGEYICAGKSSIWNTEGKLIGQLDDQTERILIYDTETELVTYERITAANNRVSAITAEFPVENYRFFINLVSSAEKYSRIFPLLTLT